MAPAPSATGYRFGRFRLVPAERLLLDAGQPVALGGRAFDMLVLLVQHAGQLVTKDELHARVWAGRVVEDNNLQAQASALRKVLGADAIATVAGQGYRFVLPVAADAPAPAAAAPRAGGRMAVALGTLAAAGLVGWVASRPAAAPGPDPRMPDRPALAVLAFAGDGNAPGAAELAQGLAGDIAAELARNTDLRVISVHSSFAVSGQGLTPQQLGQRLRVRYYIDGSARQEGELLKLRVQLVDAAAGTVAWSLRDEVPAAGLPALGDTLSRRIAGSLHTTLRRTEEDAALARAPASMDIYAQVLRAVALKHRFDAGSVRTARQLLVDATERDPGYAPAWLYLSMLNGMDAAFRITGEWHPGRAPEIVQQAERAIALDDRLPMAWYALATGLGLGGRHAESHTAARRCAQLGPSDADCLQVLAFADIQAGELADSRRAVAEALELSPVVPFWLRHAQAVAAWAAGDHAQALAAASECLHRAPRHPGCRLVRLHTLVESGRVEEARAEAAAVRAQFPGYTLRYAGEWFATDAAAALRQRAVAAERAAGIPEATP